MIFRSSLRLGFLLGACTAAFPVAVVSSTLSEQPNNPKPVATVYTLDAPPTEIADALRDLANPDAEKRKAAGAALAGLEDAEPYLRHYRTTKEGKANGTAGDALDALEVARAKRNVKRVPEWAKAGRYDVLVDVSLHLTTTEQSDEVGQAFFDFAEAIRPISPKLGGPKASHHLADSMKLFTARRELRRFHEKAGVLDTDWITHGFVRAQSCEVSTHTRFNWLVLTRNELKGMNERGNQWENCYIFHNSDVTFDNCVWSLAVCDGDVEFVKSVDGHFSTIIAHGSIRSKTGLKFDASCFFAQGDIVAKGSSTHRGLLLASGKIDVPKTLNSKDSKERVEKEGG